MTHDEAIDTLLDVVAGGVVGVDRRRGAEEHTSVCRECWGTWRLLHGLAVGETESDRLYGCESARERLYLIPGSDPDAVRRTHPELVRHLRQCASCREDLASLLRMERYADEENPAVSDETWRELWHEWARAQAGPVYELRSRLVVRLNALSARFTEPAREFRVQAFGTPAIAMRGNARGDDVVIEPGDEQLGVTLGDSGMVARIEVSPQGSGRVRLLLSVEGTDRAVAVSLREASASERLMAGQSTSASETFVVRELHPGEYVLEIEEAEPQRRFRVRLHVRPDEPQGPSR